MVFPSILAAALRDRRPAGILLEYACILTNANAIRPQRPARHFQGESPPCIVASRADIRRLAPFILFASCLAGAAHPAKILRIALVRAETGFDPAMASEIYCFAVIAAIMEPLLTFDYLARPVKIIPLIAAALPADTPWRLRIAPFRSMVAQPRVIGYKAHPVLLDEWIYVTSMPRRAEAR
jgi:hypothetical protein